MFVVDSYGLNAKAIIKLMFSRWFVFSDIFKKSNCFVGFLWVVWKTHINPMVFRWFLCYATIKPMVCLLIPMFFYIKTIAFSLVPMFFLINEQFVRWFRWVEWENHYKTMVFFGFLCFWHWNPCFLVGSYAFHSNANAFSLFPMVFHCKANAFSLVPMVFVAN